MQVEGRIKLNPIDYDDLASAARRLQEELEELRSGNAQPVTVDVESSNDEPPSTDPMRNLRSAK